MEKFRMLEEFFTMSFRCRMEKFWDREEEVRFGVGFYMG